MLAANEAVASYLTEQHAGFLRRGHADPEPSKLREFAEFARSLGLDDRPAAEPVRAPARPGRDGRQARGVRRPLRPAAEPEAGDLHPRARGPLRPGQRRLLPLHLADPPLSRPPGPSPAHRAARRARSPRASIDELIVLAEHCTRTERRAEAAERELIKVKLLTYLETTDRRAVPRHHHRRRGLRPLLPARRAARRGPGPRHQPGRRLLLPRIRDAHPDRPPLRPALPAGRPDRGPDRPRRRRSPRARPGPDRDPVRDRHVTPPVPRDPDRPDAFDAARPGIIETPEGPAGQENQGSGRERKKAQRLKPTDIVVSEWQI